MSVLFDYTINGLRGTVELTRDEYAGVCKLIHEAYQDHKIDSIKIEEHTVLVPVEGLKDAIKSHFNRIIQDTLKTYQDKKLSEEYCKDVLKDKVYRKYDSYSFLLEELISIKTLSKEDFDRYDGKIKLLTDVLI